ncbi:LuxR family two component transcriptional regulator [Haloactinospora alba]|uniref:LuxR family two component transcriptional regulator n=1 Tax=Haloactinospora alba TaxID=405555 RepID=A0A543N7H5_9ACTN|nr:response regulator transcription factor [Haloactinospora alba]TQN27785.1 LuxR family two component transcriptional regulator [Haloactinospora alba]
MRVVIADDDTLLREGVASLLRAEGFTVLAAVADAEALSAELDHQRPDIAVIDVRMPPAFRDEGIRAAIRARQRYPELPVLVLSAYVEETFATELLETGSDGVGYLLKERVGRVESFVETLRQVAGGQTHIDPHVVNQLFARTRRSDPLDRLSARERDVLALMAEGLGNAAISARLVVSEGAVQKHIRSIFAKLDLDPDDSTDRRVAAVLRFLDATR